MLYFSTYFFKLNNKSGRLLEGGRHPMWYWVSEVPDNLYKFNFTLVLYLVIV